MTTNGVLIFLMAFLFLFLGYLGVPVAFALIAGVLVVTAFTPVGLPSMMTQLFNGMDVEALLAVPFFLLVGELMTASNVTARMITLSQALIGHVRGGLAQVVTLFSMFFAGVSGSSAADVAVLSRSLGPDMKREGYNAAFIAALIASASTMANLIPPSIMAVVYGATGNVSIGGLFLGGVRPRRACWHRVDDLQPFLWSRRRHEEAVLFRRSHGSGKGRCRAADRPDHHHGRHPVGFLHAD